MDVPGRWSAGWGRTARYGGRFLAALLCVLGLAACSPQFDWRPVVFGEQGAAGVLPDKPDTQTQAVPFESGELSLTMHSAQVGGVLFALGQAPLPAPLRQDAAARDRLARWAMASFYRNVGLEPPAQLPAPGTRFVIDGQGPKGPLRLQGQIIVTPREWLEAVVIAAPTDFDRAPVDDFWLSLRWSARPAGTVPKPPG